MLLSTGTTPTFMFPCVSREYTGTLIPLVIERTAFDGGGDAIFDGVSDNFDLGGGETGGRKDVMFTGALAALDERGGEGARPASTEASFLGGVNLVGGGTPLAIARLELL